VSSHPVEPLQRVWTNPEIESPGFLTFTDETIYWLETCTAEKAAELRRRLEAGEKPVAVLPPETSAIPLNSLVSVTIDRHDALLTLGYRKGDEQEEQLVTVRDTPTRDRLFSTLGRHLGENWRPREEKYSRLGALGTPLIVAVIIAAVTAFLWWLSTTITEAAAMAGGVIPANNIKLWLLDEALYYITPLGVLIIGGLLLACVVWWMVERIQVPPHVITLTRLDAEKRAP
jgi:hypothetical protein